MHQMDMERASANENYMMSSNLAAGGGVGKPADNARYMYQSSVNSLGNRMNTLYGSSPFNNNNNNNYSNSSSGLVYDQYHAYALNTPTNAFKYNIFNCSNSFNKLCALLGEWCDIMLVENSVYLKYLSLSKSVISSICSTPQPTQSQTQSASTATPTSQVSSSSKSDETNGVETTTTDQQQQQKQQQQQEEKSSSTSAPAPQTPIAPATTAPTSTTTASSQINSYVILRMDSHYVPYISIELLFHSSATYSDRMQLINSLKEKLFDLSFKSPIAAPQSATASVASAQVVEATGTASAATSLNVNDDSSRLDYKCCHLLFKVDLY